MRTLIDENGTREVTEQEVAPTRAGANERWSGFWNALDWRPIAEYDRDQGEAELLRAGADWALGYWGRATGSAERGSDDLMDTGPAWRDAQESMDEALLRYEPTEFAAINDEWRAALIAY